MCQASGIRHQVSGMEISGIRYQVQWNLLPLCQENDIVSWCPYSRGLFVHKVCLKLSRLERCPYFRGVQYQVSGIGALCKAKKKVGGAERKTH